MHEKNFELLQEEAVRLINVESEFLTDLAEAPGLVTEQRLAQKQTFDSLSLSQTIEILTGEKLKLQNREIVIAVVGTMKAGKSTTINAIVGSEILPNRSLPMTALPTLIRHTPGVIEPVLTLKNFDVLNEYSHNLKQRLTKNNIETSSVNFENQQDIKNVMGFKPYDIKFASKYIGQINICDLLKNLNDMVRIGVDAGLPFPFEQFNKIDKIPLIEVEFSHLSDYSINCGKLSLLDTPGPNEFGQQHLKLMLEDQLRKASAVLTVLDYTQLNSEADDEVRRQLQNIAQQCHERLFILVNKIDQRDRNSVELSITKSYISDTLMDRAITPEKVYPVSANQAFLACKAIAEMSVKGKLDANTDWVADFAKLAFGFLSWEKKLEDKVAINSVASEMWDSAGFTLPLTDVIRKSHAKADFISLKSATQKILDIAKELDTYLQVRQTGLRSSAETLSRQTSGLINDIEQLSLIKQNTHQKLSIAKQRLENTCKESLDSVKKEVLSDVSKYFEEGKAQEIARSNANDRPNLPAVPGSFENNDDPDFDPSKKRINFSNINDAESLIVKIKKRLADIVSNKQQHLRNKIEADLRIFENDLINNMAKDCADLLGNVTNRLAEDDFKVTLRMPDVGFLDLISFSQINDLDGVKEDYKDETSKKLKDGIIPKLLNKINDNWGVELTKYKKTIYIVDVNMVNIDIGESLDSWFKDISANLEKLLFSTLATEIDKVFGRLTETIEHIRADLMQSIEDKQKSKAEQDELLAHLEKLLKKLNPINIDAKGLDADLETYSFNTLKSINVNSEVQSNLSNDSGV